MLDFQLSTQVGKLDNNEYQIQILNQISSYHYLHKKQAELIEKITLTLKAFEENGFLAQLKQKHQIN